MVLIKSYMMTFLAVGGGALTVYLSIVHRYLIKYTALGILILQNISYHISRALVAGTNKAGRLRSGLTSGPTRQAGQFE
jgi:hypothetical protein